MMAADGAGQRAGGNFGEVQSRSKCSDWLCKIRQDGKFHVEITRRHQGEGRVKKQSKTNQETNRKKGEREREGK